MVTYEHMEEDVFEYLSIYIKTEIRPSKIHGVGTFALRDIKAGERVFVVWGGETARYIISAELFDKLPAYMQSMILYSYENKPETIAQGKYWLRLYKDTHFNLANPYAYTNSGNENANLDSSNGIALRDIAEGEEILGDFSLENTMLKLIK